MDEIRLSDFIAESLVSISDGVRRVQEYSRDNDGVPIAPNSVDGMKLEIGDQLVRFSVVVEARGKSGREGSGELGGAIVSIVTGSVGGTVNREESKGTHHTLEFSVPMHFQLRWAATENAH
ncbi:MAG: hypothetical protein AAGK37_16830 [Pseudomonadota bacterium]